MTTTTSEPVPVNDEEDAITALRTFLDTKALAKTIEDRLNSYKAGLMRYIQENGTVDDDGHTWVEVPGFKPIKLEARKSLSLNRERAEAWVKENGAASKVLKKRVVIEFDETAFLGILYGRDIDADQFYDETITPAFVPGRQT